MRIDITIALATLIIAGTALLGATEVVQNIIDTTAESNATHVKRWVIEVRDANTSTKEKSVY